MKYKSEKHYFLTMQDFELLRNEQLEGVPNDDIEFDLVPFEGDEWVYQEEDDDDVQDLAPGEVAQMFDPWTSDGTRGKRYCYLCETMHDPANKYRQTIVQMYKELNGRMRFHDLCRFMQRYYNKHCRFATRRIWSLTTIREHVLRHDMDPVRTVQRDIDTFCKLQDLYESKIRRVDDQGNETLPDITTVRMLAFVIKNKQYSLRALKWFQK
jgi:hypothetical protein